jgi:hypothetical protein
MRQQGRGKADGAQQVCSDCGFGHRKVFGILDQIFQAHNARIIDQHVERRMLITFDRGGKWQLSQIRWKLLEFVSLAVLAIFEFVISFLIMLWELQRDITMPRPRPLTSKVLIPPNHSSPLLKTESNLPRRTLCGQLTTGDFCSRRSRKGPAIASRSHFVENLLRSYFPFSSPKLGHAATDSSLGASRRALSVERASYFCPGYPLARG